MLQATNFDWPIISTFTSLATLVGTVGVGGIMWGKLTERVTNLSGRVDVHRRELDGHENDIVKIKVDVGQLQAWKDGYSAAQQFGHSSLKVDVRE